MWQPLVRVERQVDRGCVRPYGRRGDRRALHQRPQRDEQHHQHRRAHGRCGGRRRVRRLKLDAINLKFQSTFRALAARLLSPVSTRLAEIARSYFGMCL